MRIHRRRCAALLTRWLRAAYNADTCHPPRNHQSKFLSITGGNSFFVARPNFPTPFEQIRKLLVPECGTLPCTHHAIRARYCLPSCELTSVRGRFLSTRIMRSDLAAIIILSIFGTAESVEAGSVEELYRTGGSLSYLRWISSLRGWWLGTFRDFMDCTSEVL